MPRTEVSRPRSADCGEPVLAGAGPWGAGCCSQAWDRGRLAFWALSFLGDTEGSLSLEGWAPGTSPGGFAAAAPELGAPRWLGCVSFPMV